MDVRVTVELRLNGPKMDMEADTAWEALEAAVVKKLEAETFTASHGQYVVVSASVDDMDEY